MSNPDQVTAAWLTEVLHHGGATTNQTVTSFDARRVGTGQVGQNIVFSLNYDTAGAGPATVVGKFASPDPQSRGAGVATGTYMREVRFYQQVAPHISMRIPKAFWVDENPDITTGEFVILMEDMSPASQGDQIVGCNLEVAELAVRELAGLHAPLWGSARLDEFDWLSQRDPDSSAMLEMMYGMLWPGFWAGYGAEMPEYAHEIGVRLTTGLGRYVTAFDGPSVVTHGDYRLDNMLFGAGAASPPITVVDWQTPGRGPGASDVAYFVGTSLPTDLRCGSDEALVRVYHEALVAAGVSGYSSAQCFADYRSTILGGFIMAVIASMLVGTDDRGHAMFVAMARRSAEAAFDLDVIGEL